MGGVATDDDLLDLLGPEPEPAIKPKNPPGIHTSPAALKHKGGRDIFQRSRSYDTHRAVGKKNSPARLKAILKHIINMPVTSDACMLAGISVSTLKYWLQKSSEGLEGDGFDVVFNEGQETEEKIRFHDAWDEAMIAGVERLEKAAITRAMGYKEPLTFQGRVIYKQDPILLALGMTGMDAYLLDDDGKPVPETVLKQDPDLMMFILKARKPETYGNKQQIDVNHRGGVLVVGMTATTPEALNTIEAEYREHGRPPVTFEDDEDPT